MPHFFDRKETGRKETPRPALRSLINCKCSSIRRITRYRSNKSAFDVLSHNIYCSLRKGRIANAQRSFSCAERFLPTGKNTYYRVSGLIPPKAVLFHSVFFFSVHFSFCVAIKKKSEQSFIHIIRIMRIILNHL